MNQSRTRYRILIERKVLRNTYGKGGNKSAPNQQNEILNALDRDGSKKMVRRNYIKPSTHQKKLHQAINSSTRSRRAPKGACKANHKLTKVLET
jgi:hypothetical protein